MESSHWSELPDNKDSKFAEEVTGFFCIQIFKWGEPGTLAQSCVDAREVGFVNVSWVGVLSGVGKQTYMK